MAEDDKIVAVLPDTVDLKSIVSREISLAETDGSTLATKRAKAMEYYQGQMKDVASEKGRSSVVSLDVADVVGWMMPGIMRVFTASETMAVAEPVMPEDEEGARQATDLINYVFWKDNDGYRIVFSGTWDSLMGGNGVIKTYWDDTPQYKTSFHTGLTEDEYALLLSPDEDGNEPEVLASTTREEMIPVEGAPDDALAPQPPTPTKIYDCKIRRIVSSGRTVVEALPPEDYGIDGDSKTCAEARFQYHREQKTRSELIKMGFDKAIVDGLNKVVGNQDSQQAARDPNRESGEGDRTMDLIDLYECYPMVDIDGDGIAEMLRVYFGGGPNEGEVLDWEVWEDEGPFDDIPCDPMPHRWDARSIFDKTQDVQRVKTVLKRNALDNTYAVNNPQRFVKGKISNPDELFSPSFGGAIFGDVASSVENLDISYVADKAYSAMAYEDEVVQRRTGVGRSTMALDPDTLQNQTATANQNEHDASYSQIELVARNQAEFGWSKVFKKILKLEIKHRDRARIIRMRGKFVEVDPREWNADMDVTINVGLGTGSRDRDLQMLQSVLQSQLMLVDRFMNSGDFDDAIDMLPKITGTLVKMGEAAGLRNPQDFYPEYTLDKIAQLKQMAQQRQGQQPLPLQIAQMKSQSDSQIAQIKAASEQALQASEERGNQIRAQAEADKAQSDAQVKLIEANAAARQAELEAQLAQAQLQAKQLEIAAKNGTERWKAQLESLTTLEAAEIAAKTATDSTILEHTLEAATGLQEHQQAMQRAEQANQHTIQQQAAAPEPAPQQEPKP